MADYPKQGDATNPRDLPVDTGHKATEHYDGYQIGRSPPIFNVDPKRDSIVSATAKMIAEPVAEVGRAAYDKLRGK